MMNGEKEEEEEVVEEEAVKGTLKDDVEKEREVVAASVAGGATHTVGRCVRYRIGKSRRTQFELGAWQQILQQMCQLNDGIS